MAKKIFTIGHSNLTLEDFIQLLQSHQITALGDVRSHPHSRYLPHFNQNELKKSLKDVNIEYVFLGKELGARPEDLSCYDLTGKALYERIANTALFQEGLDRLLKGIERYTIALMCAEKDPMTCHRTVLICRQLKRFSLDIYHILSDGNLESHGELETRLLAKFNPTQNLGNVVQLTLFDLTPLTPQIDLEEAYNRQGLDIAYVKKEA